MKYCLDASSIFGLRDFFPRSNFPGVWEQFEFLVASGKAVSPLEIFHELNGGHEDDLTDWAKRNRSMFVAPSTQVQQFVGKIGNEYPDLYKRSNHPYFGDPWVIAFAKIHNLTVVTEERGGKLQNPKIPYLCDQYKIKYLNILGMIQIEGWSFVKG